MKEKQHFDARKATFLPQNLQHVRNTDHMMDWNAKVISKCSNARSRKFLETCYTVSSTNSYNRSIHTPKVYLPTMHYNTVEIGLNLKQIRTV